MQWAGHIGHRIRSRQIFGGAKDFCLNFLKLARKSFGPLFVRIFPMKTVFGIKKSFHVNLHTLRANFFKPKHVGRHFCRIFRKFAQILWGFAKVFIDFAQISADFADFKEFCPDFYHIKIFGGALAPPPLISANKLSLKEVSQLVWIKCSLQVFKTILVHSPNFQGGQMPVLPPPPADAQAYNHIRSHHYNILKPTT